MNQLGINGLELPQATDVMHGHAYSLGMLQPAVASAKDSQSDSMWSLPVQDVKTEFRSSAYSMTANFAEGEIIRLDLFIDSVVRDSRGTSLIGSVPL